MVVAIIAAGVVMFLCPSREPDVPVVAPSPEEPLISDTASLKISAESLLSKPEERMTSALVPHVVVTQDMPAAKTTTAPVTTSAAPSRALAPYVMPYIQPVAMLSAMPASTGSAGSPEPAPSAEPASTSTNDMTASSYVSMNGMLGNEPSEALRDAWLLVTSRKSIPFYSGDPKFLSATSAILSMYEFASLEDQPEQIEYEVDDPEAMARGMYHIREADEKMLQGDLERALKSYQDALNVFPHMTYANQQIGRLHLLRGEYNQAIDRLRQALSAAPDLAEALNDLGVAYLYDNRAADALDSFRAAREVDPLATDPIFNIGIALRRLGDDKEARQQFERCLRALPSDGRSHRELAVLDIKEGKRESALQHLHLAMDADQSWPLPVLDAATLYAEMGVNDRAVMLLTRALEIAPARTVHQVYTQSVFNKIRLGSLGPPFESRLADKARQQM